MTFIKGDALRLPFRDNSVDLICGSPPYMEARTYGIGFKKNCSEWIDWMLDATTEAVRVSKGLVLWVVAGVTRNHCYWPGPEGLLYEWWKRGGHCWRPCYWHRVGIPGSGGKQWLRADVEYVLAFKRPGPLPWADNTACGHPPKWAPGGEMSYRNSEGTRRNQWGHSIDSVTCAARRKDGKRDKKGRPSWRLGRGMCNGIRRVPSGTNHNGEVLHEDIYLPPVLANPGTLIKTVVGGGVMGDKEAHDNEAPFPEKLVEFFIRSWCPLGGICLDPFSGSGTTACVATKLGRIGLGLDCRDSQCLLGLKRMRKGLQRELV